MSVLGAKPTWHFGNKNPMPFRPATQAMQRVGQRNVADTMNGEGPTYSANIDAAMDNDMTVMSHVFTLEAAVKEQLSIIDRKLAPLLADYEQRTGDKIEAVVVEQNIAPIVKQEEADDVKNDNPAKSIEESEPELALTSNEQEKSQDDALTTEVQGQEREPMKGASNNRWTPLAIRQLKPLRAQSPPQAHQPLAHEGKPLESFSLDFLSSILGGTEWSPGLYYPATGGKHGIYETRTPKQLLPKCKTYYVLDAATEPFLPQKPGEHGAKLSVFFRDFEGDSAEKRYQNVPLFVCLDGGAWTAEEGVTPASKQKRYTYMGHYSQKRWSDKLDYDRVQEIVPESIKTFWAKLLTAKETRAEWMETALMQAFWPKPEYEGALPGIVAATTTTEATSVTHATVTAGGSSGGAVMKLRGREKEVFDDIRDYIEELREWEKEARMKAGLLKAENIMEAFGREDAAAEPGLRFWWEYLECVAFDRNYYYMLATEQRKRAPTINGDSSSPAGFAAQGKGLAVLRDPGLALDGESASSSKS